MTIASANRRTGPLSGNGVTTAFPSTFKIYDKDHVQVIQTDADDVETILTETTHYTIAGVGNSTFTVNMVTAPPTGESITLLLDVPFTQPTDLENQGAYYAETIERAFDLAAQRELQLLEVLDRSVTLPASSTITSATLVNYITGLGAISDELAALGAITTEVEALSAITTEIAGVYTVRADVATLADIAGNITTVAGVAANVTTVAGVSTAVSTLAAISAAISAVAAIAANVTTVAAVDTEVATVAGDSADIQALAAISAAISAVAAVDTDVSTVASNIAAILAASGHADDAETAAASAAALFDAFDDKYLGAKSSNPTLDNDGDALQDGSVYWNTVTKQWNAYDLGSTTWVALASGGSAGIITFTPAGNLEATNVQGALEELDTEKLGKTDTAGLAALVTAGTDEAFADTAEIVGRKADGSLIKRSWLNFKAALKTYFDTLYAATRSTVSQEEAEAGTSTTVRDWTAQRVAQAIAALGGGGGATLGLTLLGSVNTTSGTTQSITGLATTYKSFLVVLNGISGANDRKVHIALSSNNGSSYGTARPVTVASPSSDDTTGHYGNVTIYNVGTDPATKYLVPLTNMSEAGGIFSEVQAETAITGLINAMRFSYEGIAFDAGSIAVYGVS